MSLTNGRALRARDALAVAAAAGALAAGCGGGSLPQAAAPRDPTPLKQCKVAASQASPLVTEWPASEKARLESLLAEGGVAVSYSGCEMTVLDGCRVGGNYAFQRTTLSSDTIEIDDQDDLYSKLPLGAVSLEGELKRTGRLAVRTTVTGHLRLRGDPGRVPEGGVCSGATHVITALSVGAFKLLSGGAVDSGGGVEVGGASSGGRVSRAEEVMRQAGLPERCAEGTDQAAHQDCNSPIQVFLRALPKKPGQPGYVDPADRNPPPNAVRMHFAQAPEGVWSVQDDEGRPLCNLPCSRWMVRDQTYRLQMQSTFGRQLVILPPLTYAPGGHLDVQLVPPQGSLALGVTAATLGMVGLLGGGSYLFFKKADQEPVDPLVTAGIFGGGIGLLVVGIWQVIGSRWTADLKPSTTSTAAGPSVTIGPGAVQGTF